MTRSKALRVWLAGLLHAVVAGAANAAAGALADPGHFNLTHEGLTALGKLAAAGAIIGVVMYLKQSPLPVPGAGSATRRGETT
jgi:predicted RecA/RadA family phage recombinase